MPHLANEIIGREVRIGNVIVVVVDTFILIKSFGDGSQVIFEMNALLYANGAVAAQIVTRVLLQGAGDCEAS